MLLQVRCYTMFNKDSSLELYNSDVHNLTKCQSQAWVQPLTSEAGLHSQASFDMWEGQVRLRLKCEATWPEQFKK